MSAHHQELSGSRRSKVGGGLRMGLRIELFVVLFFAMMALSLIEYADPGKLTSFVEASPPPWFWVAIFAVSLVNCPIVASLARTERKSTFHHLEWPLRRMAVEIKWSRRGLDSRLLEIDVKDSFSDLLNSGELLTKVSAELGPLTLLWRSIASLFGILVIAIAGVATHLSLSSGNISPPVCVGCAMMWFVAFLWVSGLFADLGSQLAHIKAKYASADWKKEVSKFHMRQREQATDVERLRRMVRVEQVAGSLVERVVGPQKSVKQEPFWDPSRVKRDFRGNPMTDRHGMPVWRASDPDED